MSRSRSMMVSSKYLSWSDMPVVTVLFEITFCHVAEAESGVGLFIILLGWEVENDAEDKLTGLAPIAPEVVF